MLLRKIWGKSSERFIKEDPNQRKLDFEGLDLLPEEKEIVQSARQEIEQYKMVRVVVKERNQPVRKPLPEDLPRVECHLYPVRTDLENPTIQNSNHLIAELKLLGELITLDLVLGE